MTATEKCDRQISSGTSTARCKEPTRFGFFYRVAADVGGSTALPVIKDLLRDPAANAELLAPHKVECVGVPAS